MVGRPEAPKQGNTTATLALLLLTSGFAGPVMAAPNHDILCDEPHEATLDVAADDLAARPVSHEPGAPPKNPDDPETVSADELLKPRFDATMRRIFAEDEEELQEAETDEPAARRVRLPGVSDEDLVRFKRQMYRRDI